jgi:hypothetical protein
MKNGKVLIILSCLFVFALNSCKKYNEGPSISFRTKMERACAEWEVKTFLLNNEDVLNYRYSSSMTCSGGSSVYFTVEYLITRLIWKIEKNGDWTMETSFSDKDLDFESSYDFCNDYYDYSSGTLNDNGSWSFVSDKEKVEFKFNTANFWSNTGDVWVFDIIELKEKQMKLEGLIDGDVVKITLNKR